MHHRRQGNDLVAAGAATTWRFSAPATNFIWNPGDGSDIVEGQAGNDTLLFNGANINENIDISANGGRARLLTRDVANITMDLNNVETDRIHALGGADNITVNDLAGTDVDQVNIDLGGCRKRRRRPADTVVINATNGNDSITHHQQQWRGTVSGLAAEVTISNADANDRIVINGLGGNDIIDASGLGTAHAVHRQWRGRQRRPDRQRR